MNVAAMNVQGQWIKVFKKVLRSAGGSLATTNIRYGTPMEQHAPPIRGDSRGYAGAWTELASDNRQMLHTSLV
jgi:hypothetical protein